MSTDVKSVLCAGLFELMPSKTHCVRLVSRCLWNVVVKTSVVFEQVGHQSGLCQYKRSVILDAVQSSVMGL